MSIRKIWVLIGGLFLGSSTGIAAPSSAPKVDAEASSPEAAKAAAKEASSDADKWAASVTSEKTPAIDEPAEAKEEAKEAAPQKSVEKQAPAAAPVAAKPVPAKPAPRVSGLNEMRGKLSSKSYDPKAVRLSVSGGYNVEFTYDQKSAITSNGTVISFEDLGYDDELIIRYAGKDLYAVEIERVSKARRPE